MKPTINSSRTHVRPPARRRWQPFLLAFALALPAWLTLTGAETLDSLQQAAKDSADIAGTVQPPAPGEHIVLPAVEAPVRVGESLRFSVQYGIIHAGTAWLEVPSTTDWQGHPAFNLVARAQSNGFFSTFYKVRNRIESVWDVKGHFSWRYKETRREGGYRANDEIVFDHEKHEARYQDGQSYPVPDAVQDALSSFYFTRYQALPLGGSVTFDYHASRKTQPLEVKVLGRERVKTPAGTFNCVAIEPLLKTGGIFKKKGRLVIWLTDDERRMPVLMRSYLTIGSISVVLHEVKQGG